MHNPFSQFEINKIIDLNIAGLDISFTNSSLWMMIAFALIAAFFVKVTARMSIIPGRLQAAGEFLYEAVDNMIVDISGPQGRQYFSLIFSIFIFVLVSNLLGMAPYGFATTSHIIVTFTMAIAVFIIVTIIGFLRHGLHFLSLFCVDGIPKWIAPLIIVIELFTYLARPISLSIRLAANMIAGHVLLKIAAGFVVMLGVIFGALPIPLLVLLSGFEIFVAVLQAYIFAILTCVYLNDAINLHS